jgi:hypothetical protein
LEAAAAAEETGESVTYAQANGRHEVLAQLINYSIAGEYADEVRAFAIIESAENELQVGDGGQSFGLLQMHPATFKRFYIAILRFPPATDDTWTTAFIKACATFLRTHLWLNADQAERDLIVQAWNLGEQAVFVEGKRNPEYLARWLAAYEKTH